jgi:hypothetical protein
MTPERADQVFRELALNTGLPLDPEPADDVGLSRAANGVLLPPSAREAYGVETRPPPHLNPNSPQSGNPFWWYGKKAPREEPRATFEDLRPEELTELQTLLRRANAAGPGAASTWNARWRDLTEATRQLIEHLRHALGAAGAPPVV